MWGCAVEWLVAGLLDCAFLGAMGAGDDTGSDDDSDVETSPPDGDEPPDGGDPPGEFELVISTPDHDVIEGTGANEKIHALTGNDLAFGTDRTDEVIGEPGDDSLSGGQWRRHGARQGRG